MARIITMDGDRYMMTVPDDQMWRGIVENYPDYFYKKHCILRRQEFGHSIFVNSSYALSKKSEYPSYAKYLEFWSGTKNRLVFEPAGNYLPMLVPVDGMNLPIISALQWQYQNGLVVNGGAAYNHGDVVVKRTTCDITDASFRIGDTRLDDENSLLSWMWWDGCLVCMNIIGRVRMENLDKVITFYDQELL